MAIAHMMSVAAVSGRVFFQRAFSGQGSGQALLVVVPGLLLFPYSSAISGSEPAAPARTWQRPPMRLPIWVARARRASCPAGVGLTLDGLPLLSAVQGDGVVVGGDADGEQLAEDGALGP